MMSEERQCRNSIPMMCQHYPDLGISDTSPVENLLHPIRIVISHPGMRNFCAYSSDIILLGICWWHHNMLAFFSGYCAKINVGGMKLLKFILRNNDCGLTWQNDLVTFWKPGEKILHIAIWLKELIIISRRSQFRLFRASDNSRGRGPVKFRYFHEIPRNSQKNTKYREIRQKYFQIHVGKTHLILILAIRPVLFTSNVQIYLETSSLQRVNNVSKLPGVLRWTLRKTGH